MVRANGLSTRLASDFVNRGGIVQTHSRDGRCIVSEPMTPAVTMEGHVYAAAITEDWRPAWHPACLPHCLPVCQDTDGDQRADQRLLIAVRFEDLDGDQEFDIGEKIYLAVASVAVIGLGCLLIDEALKRAACQAALNQLGAQKF